MRPEEADIAWQAVRAYYAGRAAQTGRIASNAQDVDSDLVREAVKATLGNAVDYNGRGTVFAPWGVDASKFEDQVQVALDAESKARNVTKRVLAPPTGDASKKDVLVTLEEQYGELGLRQLSGNRYIVTAGRGVVPGRDGGPLVITVGE
jgi:hypothetical protein